MGTSSGLGCTSEEELKRGDGPCPTSKLCEEKGGECFPKRCPGNWKKIGPCMSDASRGCVCCKPDFNSENCKVQDPICKAKGGICQFPNCEEGFTEIGKCQPYRPFNCKCSRQSRRG